MLTLIAKAPSIPLIQTSRLTCIGMQYTVVDSDSSHVVTANGDSIICSCGETPCSHIQAVQIQRAQHAASDSRRDAYAALFDLGYGD